MSGPQNSEIPWASVQRWNANTVSVDCPFCQKIHTHGFGGSYTNTVRASHCRSSSSLSYPSYRFHYPFSTSNKSVSYEIDKTQGYYVATAAKTSYPAIEDLEKKLGDLNMGTRRPSRHKSWGKATEMITIGLEDEILGRLHRYFGGDETFTLKKLDHVVSRMIFFGDHEYVERHIQISSEAKIFIFGSNEQGDTALVLAACERYPAVLEPLLRHGSDVDHQNKAGRSALMEAALWGRIENVKHLLQYNADRNLCDNDGYQAIDLAGTSLRNEEERFERSGGDTQVYKEITFIANQARRIISELLKQPTASMHGKKLPHDRKLRTHMFRNTDRGTVELVAPIAEFPIPKKTKTISTLHCHFDYPLVAAMSGWSHGQAKITVAGRDWTNEVFKISTLVGHQLRVDVQRDQGIPGQFCACHAEKQLIAYFINKHVLLGSEADVILDAKPPILLEGATILVSRALCGDCLQFIDAVNSALGLEILVIDRSEATPISASEKR
jgi:hypothetical protein